MKLNRDDSNMRIFRNTEKWVEKVDADFMFKLKPNHAPNSKWLNFSINIFSQLKFRVRWSEFKLNIALDAIAFGEHVSIADFSKRNCDDSNHNLQCNAIQEKRTRNITQTKMRMEECDEEVEGDGEKKRDRRRRWRWVEGFKSHTPPQSPLSTPVPAPAPTHIRVCKTIHKLHLDKMHHVQCFAMRFNEI